MPRGDRILPKKKKLINAGHKSVLKNGEAKGRYKKKSSVQAGKKLDVKSIGQDSRKNYVNLEAEKKER